MGRVGTFRSGKQTVMKGHCRSVTIEEAQTLSELRDLLVKLQPLVEKLSRFSESDRSTSDGPLCFPLSNGISAHMMGAEDGTLGILFVRTDQAPRIRFTLAPKAHST